MRDRYYDRKKKVLVVSWAQPSVTILSHISKNENYELCISAGFFVTTRKKKVLVVCLAGARSLLRPEKKDTVICLAGARSLLQPEKKVLVVTVLNLYIS